MDPTLDRRQEPGRDPLPGLKKQLVEEYHQLPEEEIACSFGGMTASTFGGLPDDIRLPVEGVGVNTCRSTFRLERDGTEPQ